MQSGGSQRLIRTERGVSGHHGPETRQNKGDPLSLTPAEAADLYRSGMPACQIAAAHGITRQGAEARIRADGPGGYSDEPPF